jgi:hypothetical protein
MKQLSSSFPGSKALAPCSQSWRGAAVYAPLFLGYTDCGSSIGAFGGARRSNLTPYLPPHSAASHIQLAYRSYVRWVLRHNNPTVSMLFACISFSVLCSCCPFDHAVKLAYKQYNHWMRKEFDVSSICNGLDYFHQQCNNRHIRMDVELELLCGALDVLAWSYDTG